MLGVPAAELAHAIDVPPIESALAAPFASYDGIDFYSDLHIRAAILCSRIVRNHAFPDGNKRVAYLAMVYFIEVNGRTWRIGDQDEVAAVIEALAGRAISEDESPPGSPSGSPECLIRTDARLVASSGWTAARPPSGADQKRT